MHRSKIVGIIGSGLIGTDPFDEYAWSGSSRYFFSECNRQGLLQRAFGVEVDPIRRGLLIAKNFSTNRSLWRLKFYLDTKYYDALSQTIVKEFRGEDLQCILLQIGGIYNIKPLINLESIIVSYHDGNLAQAIKSPYFPKDISEQRIKKALDYEKDVYENLDKIFTMSQYLKNSFINDFDVAIEKVKVIGAGINFDPVPEEKNKNYEKKNILFIGVDFYRKGGDNLLHAFRIVKQRYPEAELHIVGPHEILIPSEYSQGVINHGFLSKKDPIQKIRFQKILDDSSIFVLPSLYEPFGIAPLEAMANEIPCILTNAWAFPEMVRPNVNGELVKCGDVDELAEKISALLADPDKLRLMGKAGRDLVLREFTWERVVNNLKKELGI